MPGCGSAGPAIAMHEKAGRQTESSARAIRLILFLPVNDRRLSQLAANLNAR